MSVPYDQVCIVCERGVNHPDIPEDIYPGDMVICRECDKITPNRRQAEDHYFLRCRLKYEQPKEYADELTGVRLTVEYDNPKYPGHPKITVMCPEHNILSIEQVNGAIGRLVRRTGIAYPLFSLPGRLC